MTTTYVFRCKKCKEETNRWKAKNKLKGNRIREIPCLHERCAR